MTRLQLTKDMIKVVYMKPQMISSKRAVKSMFIQEKMQLFSLQMKQNLGSGTIMSNQSMKTECYPGKKHQVTTVKVRLKIYFIETKH